MESSWICPCAYLRCFETVSPQIVSIFHETVLSFLNLYHFLSLESEIRSLLKVKTTGISKELRSNSSRRGERFMQLDTASIIEGRRSIQRSWRGWKTHSAVLRGTLCQHHTHSSLPKRRHAHQRLSHTFGQQQRSALWIASAAHGDVHWRMWYTSKGSKNSLIMSDKLNENQPTDN